MLTIHVVKEDDFEEIYSLYDQHKLVRMPRDWFSNTGLLVRNEDNILVACAFIYVTNSKRCLIEDLITNNTIKPAEDRYNAIQLIVKNALDLANKSGYKYIIGYTIEDSVLNHGKSFGFKVLDKKFNCLTLGV
jgi:hypothetical protein